MACPLIWAFDVDGTLIGSIRSERLRPGAHELLLALIDRDVTCVLWSAGGGDYAERKARELGIAHYFAAFYAKAERDERARYVVDHLAPAHHPHVFVDDSPIDLPIDAQVVCVAQFLGNNNADRGLFAVLDTLDDHLAGVHR